MIRTTFLFLFLLFSAAARAQQPATPQPDTTVFVIQPTAFQLESGEPFFRWTERPDSIDFVMFDRWGRLVAKSANPDFKIDDALVDKKVRMQEFDTYIYVLRVTCSAKPNQVFRASVVYTGKYCSG